MKQRMGSIIERHRASFDLVVDYLSFAVSLSVSIWVAILIIGGIGLIVGLSFGLQLHLWTLAMRDR